MVLALRVLLVRLWLDFWVNVCATGLQPPLWQDTCCVVPVPVQAVGVELLCVTNHKKLDEPSSLMKSLIADLETNPMTSVIVVFPNHTWNVFAVLSGY